VNIKEVVKLLKSIAKTLGKEPDVLTMRDASEGGVSERQLRKFGGLNAIKRTYFPYTEKDLAIIQDNKEHNAYVAKLEKQLGQKLNAEELFKEQFCKIKSVSIKPYKSKSRNKIKRAVNIVLSDLHIGSDIKATKTGHLDFGRVQEARRLARITQEVLDYKPQYRKETELNVLLLGDLVQNQLHDARDGAPMTEQVVRAIHLLTQQMAHFVNSYPKVNVYVNYGNHSRRTSRHHGRAVNDKWDNYETIIAYALKEAFRSYSNINFTIPMTPFVTYEVFGKKIFLTHGDGVLNVGYPGSSINTKSLEGQINKINSTLPDANEYSVFIVGHVHVGSMTHLANGAVMITNGAMVPADEYAVSIGLFENYCGQQMFESVEGYPVGDSRFIKVSSKDDNNKELDKIIKPFDELK
jgi:predicted phosphodiesterase